jgi:sec-independent protein translocase protein TatA
MYMHMIESFPGFLAFGMPSGPDLVILLLIVLVLFGAKKLPELARGLGQSVNEFKKAKEEFDKEVAKTPTTPSVNLESKEATPAPPASENKDDQKQA